MRSPLVEVIRTREIACAWSDGIADALIAIDPPADVLKRLLDPIEPEISKRVSRSLRAARFRRRSEQSQSGDRSVT